jgi:hypothetical protein
MSGLGFDDEAPGLISAKTHAVIDYVHVSTNFVAAALLWKKNRAAAWAAFGLGMGVLVNSLMTDYPGGVFRAYSFRVHGMLDYGTAAASSALPAVLGFPAEAESAYFYVQGAGETGIAALTDYDDTSGSEQSGRRPYESSLHAGRAA